MSLAKITTYLDVVSLDDCTEAFAVPGGDSLIDLVHPVTKRSTINGQTLEEIRKRYPDAQIVSIEEFSAAKAARQDAPVEWLETTEERYNEMLEVLPPAFYGNQGFLVGEPWDHHATTGQPRYQAFRCVAGKYYVSSRAMTRAEFKASGSPRPCGIDTLSPDDSIRPCVLTVGHEGYHDGGVK
jgi:hypothetical protein